MSEPPGEDEPAWAPWKRAVVTLAGAAAYLVGQHIPLPCLDLDAGPAQVHWNGASPPSILVLGVHPLLISFFLVEVMALIVPAWRPLRVGGPVARGKLRRASLIVAMVLAAFQALVMALMFETTGLAANPGWVFRFYTVILLLGATAALAFIAQLIDEHGLGVGFSILLLLVNGQGITIPAGNAINAVRFGSLSPESLVTGIMIVAGVVGATLWILSGYRLPFSTSNRSLVRLPACGAVPLWMVPALLSFVTRLTRREDESLFRDLILSVAAAAFFSWLFNQHRNVAKVWQQFVPRAAPINVQIKPALIESAIYIFLIVLAGSWLAHVLSYSNMRFPVTMVLVTAIIADLVSEWRTRCQHGELVPVWEIHRVYAVDPAVQLLTEQGIAVFPQGLRHRTLLQFFGPFVPVRLLVQPEQAQRAWEFLQAAEGEAEKC